MELHRATQNKLKDQLKDQPDYKTNSALKEEYKRNKDLHNNYIRARNLRIARSTLEKQGYKKEYIDNTIQALTQNSSAEINSIMRNAKITKLEDKIKSSPDSTEMNKKLETLKNKLNRLKNRPQPTASKYTKFNTKYMHRKELVDILFNILFNKSDVTNTK
jgi:hypothetical protein